MDGLQTSPLLWCSRGTYVRKGHGFGRQTNARELGSEKVCGMESHGPVFPSF